jgi:hypothetical protein
MMVRADATNTTALRLIKVLDLLLEQPMSHQELAMALQEALKLPSAPSSDMVLLYIKTLRHLGCDITRPSLRTSYRYSLRKHPFGLFLDEPDIDTLVQLRQSVEVHMSVIDLLNYDELVETLLQKSWLTAELPYSISDYFKNARAVDYRPWRPWIDALLQAIQHEQLIHLDYASQGPQGAKRSLNLLPLDLIATNGALYAIGLSQHSAEAVMLRVDRITTLNLIEPHLALSLRQQLLSRKQQPPSFSVYVWLPDRVTLTLPTAVMGSVEPVSTLPKGIPLWEHRPPTHCLQGLSHNHFQLEQYLLKSAYPYFVAQPLALRQKLCHSYQAVVALYAKPDVTSTLL